ncbi:hypothetical protein DMUE_6122, partial [Dictyocoela muelleri]
MERFIIEKSFKNDPQELIENNVTLKNNMLKYTRKSYNSDVINDKRQSIQRLNKKFCHVHKTTTHNDNECRIHNKRKNNNKDKSEEKKFLMNEPQPKPTTIKIPISIGNKPIEAILDTGSNHNYLTANIVQSLDLKPNLIEKEEE